MKTIAIQDAQPGMMITRVTQQNGPVKIQKSGPKGPVQCEIHPMLRGDTLLMVKSPIVKGLMASRALNNRSGLLSTC